MTWPDHLDEALLEDYAERREQERRIPDDPPPRDPYMPGGDLWPPTFAVLLEIDP